MPCCFWFWYQALLLWMTTRSPVCVPGSPAFQAHQVIMAAKACLAVTAVMAATVHPELRERKARAGDQVKSHFRCSAWVHPSEHSKLLSLVDPLVGVKGPARGRYSPSIPVRWSGAVGGGGESAPGNHKP